MNFEILLNQVEKAIHDMGIRPEETRGEESGQWLLMREQMPIYLDAWQDEESNPWNFFCSRNR